MKANRRLDQKKSRQYKPIVELQQIIKKAKKKKNQEVKEEERIEINNKLKVIEKEIKASLPKLYRQWSEAWIDDVKDWQRIIKERRKEEWRQDQRKHIEENINRRCKMIKTDQGRMIASLLNKPYKKIMLDRYLVQNKKEINLVTEPNTVLNGLAEHFQN